jgi:hypothetical protein
MLAHRDTTNAQVIDLGVHHSVEVLAAYSNSRPAVEVTEVLAAR